MIDTSGFSGSTVFRGKIGGFLEVLIQCACTQLAVKKRMTGKAQNDPFLPIMFLLMKN